MNISRIMPFLSLLLLSNAALIFPSHPHLNPSDLCPLIQIVEHELCINTQVLEHSAMHANNVSDLCALLHNYNTSFCAGEKEKFVTKPISYDAMSVRVLEHEFHNAISVHEDKDKDKDKDIRKVCPIINFIEQELCTSRNAEIKVRFDPKELCPLLNLTYTEVCE
jgi:hypothetical protein